MSQQKYLRPTDSGFAKQNSSRGPLTPSSQLQVNGLRVSASKRPSSQFVSPSVSATTLASAAPTTKTIVVKPPTAASKSASQTPQVLRPPAPVKRTVSSEARRTLPPRPPPRPNASAVQRAASRPGLPKTGATSPRSLPAPPPSASMSLRTVEQFYEIGRLLGSGGFAEVRVGTHRQTKEQVAVKIIDKKAMAAIDEESLRREIQILQMVQHPNIVTYRDCFETEAKVYLVMELLEGGELLYQVGKRTSGGAQSYTEDDARHLMLQILSAIAYLHSRGIVHRDLKPENLLFKDKTPQSPLKLCDFGLSSFVTDKNAALTQWCGTPDFTAPEVINQKGYDQQVDMWSAGVILYLLLSGTLPFQDNNTLKVYQKIRKGQYDMSGGVWEIISAEAKDLIAHMLMVEPSQRITAQQALQHMWMTQTTSSVRPLPVAELRSSLTTVQSQRKLKIVGASIIAEGQRRNPSDIAPEADNVNTRSMQQYLPAWQNQARATTMPTAPIRTGTTTNTNAHDKATDTRTNAARKLPLPPSSLSAAKKEKRAAATVLGACNNENTTISLSGSRTPSNYISVGAAAKKKISVPKESLPVRRNRRARVLWSFTGRTERELSVSAGDEVEIEEEQTEWVLAVSPSAPRHGWIPANYVTFLS